MKRTSTIILFAFLMLSINVFANRADTVLIHPGNLQLNQLSFGTHKYLVYFKNHKDSASTMFQEWNIKISKETFKGKGTLKVGQVWSDHKEVVHRVESINDEKDFRPLYQKSWWNVRGTTEVDFIAKTATFPNQAFRKNPDSSRKVAVANFIKATNNYNLNWHLDMTTYSMLPFKENRVFGINFYEVGYDAPAIQYYKVKGSAELNGPDRQKINCWILVHETPGNVETYWISKKTFEVLKMEQQFGNMYRYKVKF